MKLRNTLLLLVCSVSAVFSTGCLVAPVMPPPGLIYTDYKAPLDHNVDATRLGGMREGRAQSISYVGLVAQGDASISAAARSANITTVHAVDYEYKNIVGIIQTYTTVVIGE